MYIRARGANSFTGGNRKTAAARRADNRATSCTFLSAHDSLEGPCRKVHPDVANSRASFVRARTRCTEKRTTIEQPGTTGRTAAARSQGRNTNAATRTGISLQEAHCAAEESTNDGKRRKAGGEWENKKNPSQHEVVRDGRRVTDGIRTHDIQNHNLTL